MSAAHRWHRDPSQSPRPARRVPMGKAEERELARLAQGGDTGARDRLVLSHQGLVRVIARRFEGRGLDFDDLVSAGQFGLFRAVDGFDPAFGTRFISYAAGWISQAIGREVLDTSRTVRVPIHARKLGSRWDQAEGRLLVRLGATPSAGSVAREAGVGPARAAIVADATAATRRMLSLSSPHADALAPLDPCPPPPDALSDVDSLDRLREVVAGLPARYRDVLTLRHGLAGGPPRTLRAAAEACGMSREWVATLEARAIRVARRAMGLDPETGRDGRWEA